MAVRDVVDAAAGRRRLVVTTSFPRHAADSAGNFVAERVRALIAGGERVQVIAAGASEQAGGPDEPAGAPVHRIPFAVPGVPPLFYGGGAPERLEATPLPAALQAVRFWGGLLPALRARLPGVQVVESHWLLPSTLAVAACLPPSPSAGPAQVVPVSHVAHVHSGDVALLERLPAGGALARWLLGRVAAVVTASEDLRDRLRRLAGWPVLDPEQWLVRPAHSPLLSLLQPRPPADERRRLREGRGLYRPVVLAVGRLVAIKGHDLLVRAVSRLPAPVRPALVILGEGDQRAALHTLARARGVDLHLPGEVPPAEVKAWLALAEVFAQPSRTIGRRSEGQPVAVREALAAGVPVVATATGGIPELSRSLVQIPPEDPGALAEALIRHLSETPSSPMSPAQAGILLVSGA